MKPYPTKKIITASILALWAFLATGTSVLAVEAAGTAVDKTASMAGIYGFLAAVSMVIVVVYCATVRKKDLWFVLLYISVFVVNAGYFTLSLSTTLEEALLANRISYLGSVFLPLCMLLIIMDTCRIKPNKYIAALLVTVSICIFLLAASGGYLKLYYTDVSIVYINGVARLNKVYGPLHFLYLVYLLLYFAMMIAVIVYAIIRKYIAKPGHTVILASIVLGNIGVWFIEQLIYVEFEFLSITYIISEIFLLLLYRMLQEYNLLNTEKAEPTEHTEEALTMSLFQQLLSGWPEADTLTARELEVLNYILENKKRRDIAEAMCVSENTVKKHTSHIFAKLGITSRSELFARLAADTHEPGTHS